MLNFNDRYYLESIEKIVKNLSKYKTLSKFDMQPLAFKTDGEDKYASILFIRKVPFNMVAYEVVIDVYSVKVYRSHYISKSKGYTTKSKGDVLVDMSTEMLNRFNVTNYSNIIKDTILMFG